MIVNIIACIIAIYLIYIGIKNKLIKTTLIGICFLIADFLMIYDVKYMMKLFSNKYIFIILFMIIPAFIFSPILFLESYKYQDYYGIVKLFCICLFFVDTWHAFEYLDYKFKYYLYFIISILLILYFIRKYNTTTL